MNIHSIKPYFTFSKSHRAGLLTLCALIITFQLIYVFADFKTNTPDCIGKKQWLALQKEIDMLQASSERSKLRRFPFNPNFISDFKGYQLGMSVEEIDRLLAFRKTNKYVNSASEFQQVTKVSDSLLAAISPYFKFPDWIKDRKEFHFQKKSFNSVPQVLTDINLATRDDLKKVYGIGDGLSDRILQEKEKLGGFVSMEQLKDVWGLSPEVIANINKSFNVQKPPNLKKIKINDLSIKELGQFPYFRYPLSKSIVTYRSMNGKISSIDDLTKIPNFPVDKVRIIALYLEF